jgi:hypothetical protein
MNTKNIGVMNWDSIINLLIFHLKNGKKVNVNIYGDNLSFTFDSKSFCFAKTFIVKIDNEDNGNYEKSSLSSMVWTFLKKQHQKKISSKITYNFDGSLDVKMNNRTIYNVMSCKIVNKVIVTNDSDIWSWPSPDGSGYHKVGDIEIASEYLFNGKV